MQNITLTPSERSAIAIIVAHKDAIHDLAYNLSGQANDDSKSMYGAALGSAIGSTLGKCSSLSLPQLDTLRPEILTAAFCACNVQGIDPEIAINNHFDGIARFSDFVDDAE